MSLDLLEAFGSPQGSLGSQLLDHSTINRTSAEEEDFGDFEEPESEQSISLDHTKAFGSQGQTSAIRGVDGCPNDHADQSVLFDADQEIKTRDNRTKHLQVKEQGAVRPLNPSLDPIISSDPVLAAKVPQSSVLSPYEYENPTNITQTPITPVKSTTTTAIATFKPIPNYEVPRTTNLGPPPTNIPPPSVLLPLVTTLFQSMSADVKKVSTSERVSSDPYEPLDEQRVQQIQGILSDARAGARIMAGRKLRWKRDRLLSQSMKIGPATGKVSGMKLAGVDKAETRREDQEAAEALRTWKQQAGSLRATVSMVNVHLPGNGLSIPDIAEAMPIRAIKSSEGAVTAPKCCVLCGIKRDERVAKVDVDVEDSFGEWWTEFWGHVDCVAFWLNHKASLRQR